MATITKSNRSFVISARFLSFIVLMAAIGISGYLSYLKLTDTQATCVAGGTFDCGTVLNSAYSELFDIPIAWLGLATNVVVVVLLLLEPHINFLKENGAGLVFGVVLFAFLFSVYLVYIQAQVIKAYCPWCLTHEALITVLFLLSSWRVFKDFSAGIDEEDAGLQTQ